jgi:hypothetical protein
MGSDGGGAGWKEGRGKAKQSDSNKNEVPPEEVERSAARTFVKKLVRRREERGGADAAREHDHVLVLGAFEVHHRRTWSQPKQRGGGVFKVE